MNRAWRYIRYLLPSCAAIIVGGGTLFLATDGLRAVTEEGARRLAVTLDQPRLPVIRLENMDRTALELGGDGPEAKITLVEFIYARCPTICQAAGSDYAILRDKLKQAGFEDRVRLISASFDPKRDDPEEMQAYADRHGADGALWTIARVQPNNLEKLMKEFGLRVIPDEWGGYQHNAAIHIISESGHLTNIVDIDAIDEAFDFVSGQL